MAQRAGRTQRTRGVGPSTRPSTVRMREAMWEKAEQAAASLGVSRDAYLDRYMEREELDEHGRPVWWTDPIPADQQELPLRTA